MKRKIPNQYTYDMMELLSTIRAHCPLSHIEVDSRGIIEIRNPDPTPEQLAALRPAIIAILKNDIADL